MRTLGAVTVAAALLAGLAGGVRAQDAGGLACRPQAPVANRKSPYDSTEIVVKGQRALVCYSRPSLRGRHMIGGEAVPLGKLWRTGANEPTTLHIPFAATVAGLPVEPGSYSLYTIPAEKEWTVIVNRSTKQWGVEGQYTPELEKQEVGRSKVAAEALKEAIEQFTIRSVPAGAGAADLVLEWEHSRVKIPVRAR